MRLAINESFTDKAGERRETTLFVDIEIWGHQAETCNKYLSKGRQVLVDGRLKRDQWQDKEGNNRSRLLVKATHVTFLDSRPAERKDLSIEIPPVKVVKEKLSEPDYPPDWDDLEVPPFG